MTWILRTDSDSVSLHEQFVWIDEHSWTNIAQSEPVYTLTGAMDIQQGIKKAGRPITLSGEHVWQTRQSLIKLIQLTQIPELVMTLIHPKGQSHQVIFNRPALDNITPIYPQNAIDETDDDYYRFDVRFLTV